MTTAACSGGDELACGGAGKNGAMLDGSYCEDIEINFTEAQVRRQQATGSEEFFMFVRYVNGAELTNDGPRKVLDILIPSSGVEIAQDKAIQLTMVQGASVRRFPSGADEIQAIDLTPELQDVSTVTFTQFTGEIGSAASGEFAFLFMSGRTLSGTFSGDIIDNTPQ